MPVQTTYSATMGASRAGHIADMRGSTLVSFNAEAALAFGVPVSKGTAEGQCKKTAAGATDIIGVTVRDRSVGAGQDGFVQYDSARVMTEGAIWVTVTAPAGVVAGDLVWVKKSDGTFGNVDAGAAGSLRLNGRWETTAANGALAVITFNSTVPAVAGA